MTNLIDIWEGDKELLHAVVSDVNASGQTDVAYSQRIGWLVSLFEIRKRDQSLWKLQFIMVIVNLECTLQNEPVNDT